MAFNDPSLGGIGASFDPTRQVPGPQASSPAQALQVISMHLPQFQGGRGVVDPTLANAPSHLGQTPEALVLSSLLAAAHAAGTTSGPSPASVGSGSISDLLDLISRSMGSSPDSGGGAPGAPSPGLPAPPPASSPAPVPPVGGPPATPSFSFTAPHPVTSPFGAVTASPYTQPGIVGGGARRN